MITPQLSLVLALELSLVKLAAAFFSVKTFGPHRFGPDFYFDIRNRFSARIANSLASHLRSPDGRVVSVGERNQSLAPKTQERTAKIRRYVTPATAPLPNSTLLCLRHRPAGCFRAHLQRSHLHWSHLGVSQRHKPFRTRLKFGSAVCCAMSSLLSLMLCGSVR